MIGYGAHLKRLEGVLESLDSSQAFAIAAACAERQWPVYDRASQGRPWSQADALRRTLDAVWDWLLRKRGRPKGFAHLCESAILEEIEDDAANAASEVARAFFGLASIVESDKKDHVLYAAKENLSFIEAFLSDLLGIVPSSENVAVIDGHELMQAEIARQRTDLDLVSRGAPLPPVVEQLRAGSEGVSVLGSYWYQ